MKKAFRDALESEGVIIDENRESRPTTPLSHSVTRTKSTPTSPRTNKKESTTSPSTALGIQRHNSDQMLKSDVGTAADPREKFQQRKSVSTPSLNFEESTSVDDNSLSLAEDGTSSTSVFSDSSRSQQQQRSSSLADSDSLVIRQKKRFLNLSQTF